MPLNTCRIEICGGIASGKTTLANLLSDQKFMVSLEDFKSNPFWKPFYDDPVAYAFETELTFLLQHYHQIKAATMTLSHKLICDFSLILDLAYAEVTLKDSKKEMFVALYNHIDQELNAADLIIHLKCSPETQLSRIRHRGRSVEQDINVSFLSAINDSLTNCLHHLGPTTNILSIESETCDFANDQGTKHEVIDLILYEINQVNR